NSANKKSDESTQIEESRLSSVLLVFHMLSSGEQTPFTRTALKMSRHFLVFSRNPESVNALKQTSQSTFAFCAWPVRRKTLPLGQSRKTSQFEQSGLRA